MTTATNNRARFPELAELVDTLRSAGMQPRVTSIQSHDGKLLAGELPEPGRRLFDMAPDLPARLAEHYRIFRVREQRPGREFGYPSK